MSTLNGLQVTHATVDLSITGPWSASATLFEPALFSVGDRAELVVDGRRFTGTIASGQDVDGRTEVRIVSGKGKASLPLGSPVHRHDDTGVKLSAVLSALAGLTGETIDVRGADSILGLHWTACALDTLAQCLDRIGLPWRHDDDGVIRVGTIPAGLPVDAGYALNTVSTDSDMLVLTPDEEELEAFELGRTVAIPEMQRAVVIRSLRIVEDPRYLRCYVNILPATFARDGLAAATLGSTRFVARYPYKVVSVYGSPSSCIVDAQSTIPGDGLPAMLRIPHVTGCQGMHALPKVGDVVIVAFERGSPSSPVVVGYLSNIPSKAVVDGDAVVIGSESGTHPPAARRDDPVSVGSMQVITSTLLGPTAFAIQRLDHLGAPSGPPVVITLGVDATQTIPLAGVITGGSGKVTIQ